MKIPEIWTEYDDKNLHIKELKKKYIEYVKSNFIKTPHLIIENENKKWKIEISTQVFKEWRQKSRTKHRILAIKLFDEMLRTAVFVKTEKDNKNTRGIESVSEFENWCKIDGKLYKIRIIIKKQPNRYFAYYYGAVEQYI